MTVMLVTQHTDMNDLYCLW